MTSRRFSIVTASRFVRVIIAVNRCAIAKASASLMTERVKGRTLAEDEDLFGRLRRMMTSAAGDVDSDLGELSVLADVRQFPVRMKCAMLPWQTLRAAVAARDEIVSTE